MRVTIRQIAEESGLSLQTVSQILNDRGGMYKEDTRERVLSIARELGYRPNSSARAMRSGRFGAVSLLLSQDGARSLLPAGLLDGILDGVSEANLSLTIARLPEETLVNTEALPRVLRELSVDGLLIKYDSAIPEPMRAFIAGSGFPAIWINSKQPADCIYPDDYDAARRATEHLIAQGHERIAHVDWLRPDHYSREDRMGGYLDAMAQAGKPSCVLQEWPDLTDAASIRRSCGWLLEADRPTGVLTYSGEVAVALYHIATVLGLSVPGDLSLLTFTDSASNPIGPPFATLRLPQREIGKEAVQMLIEKIEMPSLIHPPRPMVCPLVTTH